MTDSITLDSTDTHGHSDHDDHAHPTEKQYWIVFVILAVITAVEIAWSYMGLEGPALVVPLIIMMVVKFLMIAGVFMHLSFDSKMPNGRTFYLCFGAAMVLAILVFLVVLAAFEFQI